MWQAHLKAYRLKHPRVDYNTARKRASKTYQKMKKESIAKTRRKSFLQGGWRDIYNLITNPLDHLLLSETPHISKLQCGKTCVNLIGETHNKKFRSQFLSRFLDRINEEGQNPQSVILVEARPWENVKDDKALREMRYPSVGNKEIEIFLCSSKDKVSPIRFFIAALAWDKSKLLLPYHKIVPFDYRVVDTIQGEIPGFLTVLTAMKGITKDEDASPDEFLERMYRGTPIEFEKSLDEQIRRLSPDFLDQSTPIVKRLVDDFKDKAKYAKQRLLNNPPKITNGVPDDWAEYITFRDEATGIVNDLFKLFNKIPEVVLVSQVQRYMRQGTTNIHVFIGHRHIAGTEQLLRETFGCV
jgi:hypothetical protein